MADEQVKDKPDPGVHEGGSLEGNTLRESKGPEAGREDIGQAGADRPAGTRTARDSTSINPKKMEAQGDAKDMPPA